MAWDWALPGACAGWEALAEKSHTLDGGWLLLIQGEENGWSLGLSFCSSENLSGLFGAFWLGSVQPLEEEEAKALFSGPWEELADRLLAEGEFELF